jgi:hypothetical protein
MTAAESRERARLRSERWRRARGIGPRKPAERPWLALGISRSTWYRRRAKTHKAVFARVDGLLTGLARELARADTGLREMGAIIAELEACRAAVPLRC